MMNHYTNLKIIPNLILNQIEIHENNLINGIPCKADIMMQNTKNNNNKYLR